MQEHSLSVEGWDWPRVSDTSATPSPAIARALLATEDLWQEIESKFGMLTSAEAAEAVLVTSSPRAHASKAHANGRWLRVRRGNHYLYPGFQFDRSTYEVKPAIPALIALDEASSRSLGPSSDSRRSPSPQTPAMPSIGRGRRVYRGHSPMRR